MKIDEIKKLIEVVKETGIHELEVREGEDLIRVVASAQQPAMQTEKTESVVKVERIDQGGTVANTQVPSNAVLIRAPMAGTFYRSPAPEEPPFVEIGQRVDIGDVLCIIESMKMMNEIKSDRIGVVVGAPIENGQAIESDTPIFHIS